MPIRRATSTVFAITALTMLGITGMPAQQVLGGNPQGPPPRDRMLPPRTGTASIKGRVVDGVTGAAVARARVSVQGPNRLTAVTDGTGAFAFANLPGGPFMLLVEKATYMAARYPAAGRTIRSGSRPLTLTDGQVLDNITVPLFHGGAIMGRVLDANGDPVDNAQISLMRVPSPGRPGRPAMRGGSGTDDRGEYRIGRLEAGTYLIQVNTRRNFGPDMMAMAGAPAVPEPPTPQPLPTYYPNALAIDQAQPITVDRGQTITDIDVVLAEGIPGTVNGVVTSADGSSMTNSNTFVNVRRINGDTTSGFDGFSNGTGVRPDGSFKLTLPPGEYQIEARLSPRMGTMRPEDEQYATSKITVTSGSEDNVSLVVGRAASATGRVVFEGTTPVPPSPGKMRIPLYSDNGMCRSGEATIAADWSFHVEGLAGTCSAPPFGMFGRWMLKAVLFDGADLAESPVTFEPGQQFRNVQVVVTDRRTELSFRVADDNGQPTREYVIVVYPVEKSQWRTARIFVGPPPISMTARAGPGQTAMVPGASVMPARREALNGLRPGEYYVIAVDDLEPDDYRDPAVLERLRPSATRVTLPDGGAIDVPLRRSNFAALVTNR